MWGVKLFKSLWDLHIQLLPITKFSREEGALYIQNVGVTLVMARRMKQIRIVR
jgi:hypothetical protein